MKHLYLYLWLLITAGFLLMAKLSEAQSPSDIKLTLQLQNQNLRTLLSGIQKSSGIQVVFNEQLVTPYNNISVSVNNGTVSQALGQALKNTQLRYIFQANKIVIAAKPANRAASQNIYVSGKISDATGSPLPGATVKLLATGKLCKGRLCNWRNLQQQPGANRRRQ